MLGTPPYTPGILYECQKKGVAKRAICNRQILKELRKVVFRHGDGRGEDGEKKSLTQRHRVGGGSAGIQNPGWSGEALRGSG